MTSLRVGLIGLGSMGRHHARVIRETECLDLVAVADPGGDRFQVAGDLEVLPNVEALIDAGIDAAMVAVPTVYHEDTALKLAAAGVHTMVEKPIAADVESGKRVADAFAKAGLVGAVGYVERCNPALLEMRKRLADGELGELYQISTRRQSPFPARISDVGVVKDLATHDVDLVPWLVGAEYERVFAQTAFRSGREFEDMVTVSGKLSNGVLVSHLVNWLTPYKDRTTVVIGEKGALVADTAAISLTFYRNGTIPIEWTHVANFRGVTEGEVTGYQLTQREPLRVEHEKFRDAILGKNTDYVSMEQGVRTLEVVDGILTSARNNDCVAL